MRKVLVNDVFRSVVCLAVVWGVMFALTSIGNPGWVRVGITQLVGLACGMVFALYIRAWSALFLQAVLAAAAASELAIHAVYGIGRVQGFSTHIAILLAAALGAILAAVILRSTKTVQLSPERSA